MRHRPCLGFSIAGYATAYQQKANVRVINNCVIQPKTLYLKKDLILWTTNKD